MTESELLIVLNRFLDSNVKLSLLTYVGAAVVSIIVGVFSASVTAYFKKSAEVSALSDRIDETCKQLEQQAKVVKRVEADISNQTWIEQQRWLFRKDLYLAIIDLLIRAREQSLALDEMINSMPGFYFDEENITPVAEEIALLVNRQGRLFLSKNALLILADFYNSGETWYKKELEEERFDVNNLHSPYGVPSGPTEHGYLCHYSKAAKEAYRMIIREAKSDLKIDITLVNSKS